MITNYYQILGLSSDCSKEDIKNAYRIYATKFHPDKQNSDKFFEERFKEIKNAYDILIDDNKRADFDSKFSNSSKTNFSSFVSYHQNIYNKSKFEDNKSKFEDLNIDLRKMEQEKKEKKEREDLKRQKVYFTNKDIILNGLYINFNGKSYQLVDYEISTIRKDNDSNFGYFGVILIIIGILTIAYFIGIFLIFLGIFGLFYKEYFIILIGNKGDTVLMKGQKSKMRKISNLINKSIKENT